MKLSLPLLLFVPYSVKKSSFLYKCLVMSFFLPALNVWMSLILELLTSFPKFFFSCPYYIVYHCFFSLLVIIHCYNSFSPHSSQTAGSVPWWQDSAQEVFPLLTLWKPGTFLSLNPPSVLSFYFFDFFIIPLSFYLCPSVTIHSFVLISTPSYFSHSLQLHFPL